MAVTDYHTQQVEMMPRFRIGTYTMDINNLSKMNDLAPFAKHLDERSFGSDAYPPVWEYQITIQHECDERFTAGMAFYIHSSLQSMEDREGMLLGGSFLMTDNGPERLDRAPLDLVIVDG